MVAKRRSAAKRVRPTSSQVSVEIRSASGADLASATAAPERAGISIAGILEAGSPGDGGLRTSAALAPDRRYCACAVSSPSPSSAPLRRGVAAAGAVLVLAAAAVVVVLLAGAGTPAAPKLPPLRHPVGPES